MKRLELHRETLRDLTDGDLAAVAGGAYTTTCPDPTTVTTINTQTIACPSGATWKQDCESMLGPCC